jgi:hypothetical protein
VADDLVHFEGENADMLIKVVAPDCFQFGVTSVPHSRRGVELNNLRLTPTRPVQGMHYLTVLYPLRKGEDEPHMTSERTDAGVAIHVKDDLIMWTSAEGLQLE